MFKFVQVILSFLDFFNKFYCQIAEKVYEVLKLQLENDLQEEQRCKQRVLKMNPFFFVIYIFICTYIYKLHRLNNKIFRLLFVAVRHYEVVYLIHEKRAEEVESVNQKVQGNQLLLPNSIWLITCLSVCQVH